MDDFEWLTYPGARGAPHGVWIRSLQADRRVRKVLEREIRRLSDLAYGGHYFDAESTPIPQVEADKYRHDLELWDNPRAVLSLLENDTATVFMNGLGPTTRGRAIIAIKALIAET